MGEFFVFDFILEKVIEGYSEKLAEKQNLFELGNGLCTFSF